MMKDSSKLFPAVVPGSWTNVCDSCRVAARVVYCQVDSAYLCIGCDSGIHAVNSDAWLHKRILVCESCESMPAAFSCKADAASLCINCDAKIHSANALSSRHHRIPVLPFTGLLNGPSPGNLNRRFVAELHAENGILAHKAKEEEEEKGEKEDETSSWLLLNPLKNNQSNEFLFGNEVEEYLDLEEYNSCSENQYCGNSESVVPVQCGNVKNDHYPKQHLEQQQHQQNLQLEMDFEASKTGFNYNSSISNSVSMSSMEASTVPDSNMNDIANSHTRSSKGTIDLFSNTPYQVPAQFSSMDREARVLRYREKRKTRKFEKTIRYASRKAYAETRPRIKGRFAKRTDAEYEVDQIYVSNVISENGYCVVPSF